VSFAPAQWVVQLLSLLPEALRPGALAVVVVLLVWFVATGGLRVLWHAACRWTALAVDELAGLVTLVEYRSTSARRKRDEAPSSAALAASELAARTLDRAARLHERHASSDKRLGRVPWEACLVLLALSAAAWIAMDRVPPDSRVSHELSKAWERWRDVEAWADVPDSRRAERGPGLPVPLPVIVGTRRVGGSVRVRIACSGNDSCHGRVIVRSGGGRLLLIRHVRVEQDSSALLLVGLAGRRGGVPAGASIVMRR
jgi:hypothetical protein